MLSSPMLLFLFSYIKLAKRVKNRKKILSLRMNVCE